MKHMIRVLLLWVVLKTIFCQKISLPITYRYIIHVLTTWYQTYLIMPCLVPYLQRALSWLPSEIQYVGTQYTRLRTRIYTVYTVYVRWLQAMVTVHSVCVAYVWDHKVQFDPLSSVDGMWNAAVCLRVDGSSEISPLLLRSTLCGVQVTCC